MLAIPVEAASKDIESYSEVWSSQEGWIMNEPRWKGGGQGAFAENTKSTIYSLK